MYTLTIYDTRQFPAKVYLKRSGLTKEAALQIRRNVKFKSSMVLKRVLSGNE